MGDVKIPYYVVKRGRGFWQPTRAMRAAGYRSVPCGADGPIAWARATAVYEDYLRVTRGGVPAKAKVIVPHSCGEAWQRYRRTVVWTDKKPRTREDWDRAWKWIEPLFGDTDPRVITLERIAAMREAVKDRVSVREAHRVIKVWRAFWKAMAAMGYCDKDADPSLGMRNRAAKGRSATWTEGEVARLGKRAWRMGYYGLAAVIAVAWDTQLSPGDIRALTASQIARNGSGSVFFTSRGKTGVPVGGALSARAVAVLAAYLGKLGVEMMDDALLFRTRTGSPYSINTVGEDFREVRIAEFGPEERRMLGHDFRRSGAVEAVVGEARPAAVAHAMGNSLSTSNMLFETYVPVNLATIRSVADARRLGRRRLREENGKR